VRATSGRGLRPQGAGCACGRASPSPPRALAHDLVVRPRDPAEETEALLGVAGWAAQFTPSVADEPPDTLVLEVSGSLRLFGGVDRMRASLLEGCTRMGFTALAASAPTARGAAWLARAGAAPCIEHADALESALAALPLRIAVRTADTLEALHAIGARTVGDLAALPRDGLARASARRSSTTWIAPRAAPIRARSIRRRSSMPASGCRRRSRRPTASSSRRDACSCSSRLPRRARRRRAAARAALFHCEARRLRFQSASSRRAARSHFTLLARERLGRWRSPNRCAPSPSPRTTSCRSPAAAALFADTSGGRRTGKLVERLRARLGAASVHGVCGAAEHRPEYASRACEPTLARGNEGGEGEAVGLRPLWLLAAPRPIAEVGAVPHHGGPLKLLAGPERIESGWWDGGEVARDYFVAQTPEHALVWIYRARGAAGGWFLHGLFA
jgi:protein ImuB